MEARRLGQKSTETAQEAFGFIRSEDMSIKTNERNKSLRRPHLGPGAPTQTFYDARPEILCNVLAKTPERLRIKKQMSPNHCKTHPPPTHPPTGFASPSGKGRDPLITARRGNLRGRSKPDINRLSIKQKTFKFAHRRWCFEFIAVKMRNEFFSAIFSTGLLPKELCGIRTSKVLSESSRICIPIEVDLDHHDRSLDITLIWDWRNLNFIK